MVELGLLWCDLVWFGYFVHFHYGLLRLAMVVLGMVRQGKITSGGASCAVSYSLVNLSG